MREPSVNDLGKLWQAELQDKFGGYRCALDLSYQFPNGRKGQQHTFAEDSVSYYARHTLGHYYLDDMYYVELAAYLEMPSVWQYIRLRYEILYLLFMLACAGCTVILWRKDRKMSDDNARPSEIVRCIGEGRYRIGELLWDEKEAQLVFQGETRHCAGQANSLLAAFVRAEDYFLSNGRISEVCGWNPKNAGVSASRRKAMFGLRQLLMSKPPSVNVKLGKNKNGENGYYLCIKPQ